ISTTPPAMRSSAISRICCSVGASPISQRFTFRTFEQLARVRDCGSGDLLAAQHPGNLLHPLLGTIEPADARARVAAGILLPHEKMRGGEAGDLWKVRDADDLIARRELLQLSADDFGDAAADAGVDLVEDERCAGGARRCLEQRRGDRQLDARQLAPGGDALHRLRLLAAIRRDEDLHAIESRLAV